MGKRDRPLLALTLGDTAGVGPEIVLKTLADTEARSVARMLVIGDLDLLRERAYRIHTERDMLWGIDELEEIRDSDLDFAVLDRPVKGAPEDVLGRVDARAGRASVLWVKEAAQLALAGDVDGIVTAPINKLAVKLAGFDYEGHTEILGEVTGAEPVMMLVATLDRQDAKDGTTSWNRRCTQMDADTTNATPRRSSACIGVHRRLLPGVLRVAIVTRHCALREVPGLVTGAEIVRTAGLVAESMRRDFRVLSPRIGVLALNPHASDGGRFGDEEERVIAPAVAELRAGGVDAIGPLVPDVAFWQAVHGEYDAVVAMYHDQGLIPLKTLAFDRGVNATLGLPICRTSPDHGTAFDIAGEGRASHVSFAEAVKLCAAMTTNRKKGLP